MFMIVIMYVFGKGGLRFLVEGYVDFYFIVMWII